MKKYFVTCVAVLACSAQSSFAQMKLNHPLAQKNPVIQIPVVHATPVSSPVISIHIDTIKPFEVSLNPINFGEEESAACEYFKKLKATLVLDAERTNDVMANLHWQTKYAFYATGFNIERSVGDSLHFSAISFAPVSEGTGFKQNYSSPDYNDYSGFSYYRIKQRNGDTGFIYSNIVAIKGVEALSFRIYPNPASNKLFINVAPKQSGRFAIMIYDPSGKIVQQQSASCTQNNPIVQSINISKLTAGSYQVKILMPDKTFFTGTFIK